MMSAIDDSLRRGIALGLSGKQLAMAATASEETLMRAGFNALLAGREDIRDFFVEVIKAKHEAGRALARTPAPPEGREP
jgi:hypothetical protein